MGKNRGKNRQAPARYASLHCLPETSTPCREKQSTRHPFSRSQTREMRSTSTLDWMFQKIYMRMNSTCRGSMCERDVGMAPQAGEEVTGTVDAELWKTSRISRNIHCRAQQSKHIVGWCVRKDAIRRKQDLLKPEAALEEAYNCLGENLQSGA